MLNHGDFRDKGRSVQIINNGDYCSIHDNKKVHEIVNKYYYDIESITVYFGRYSIFAKSFKHRRVAVIMLLLMLSISYHAFVVVAAQLPSLASFFPNYIYNSKVLNWVGYLVSLLLYVVGLIYIDKEKQKILEKVYGSKKIQVIQNKWLEENIPSDLSAFSLVSKSTQWFEVYHKVKHNDFLSTGKILQNSTVNIVLKNLLGVIGLSISAMLLGGLGVSELVSAYPSETVLIVFYLLLLGLELLIVYGIFQLFIRRLLSAIDNKGSKSSYRFNIFNSMLLHHVTLKELNEI